MGGINDRVYLHTIKGWLVIFLSAAVIYGLDYYLGISIKASLTLAYIVVSTTIVTGMVWVVVVLRRRP